MRCSPLLLIMLFFSCTGRPGKERLFPLSIKAGYDPAHCIVIYLFNPSSCESCKSIDHSFFQKLAGTKKISKENIVCIMPYRRPVEIPVFLKEMLGEKWETWRENVISNDTLWEKINKMNHIKNPDSYLMIYTPGGDSVLYQSFLREAEDSVINRYIE